MNEKEFMKNLMVLVDFDNSYENKTQVLDILGKSYLEFNKTSAFTHKSWQCYEHINLRVPIPIMSQVEKYKDYIEEKCQEIYVETEEYDFGSLFIKPGAITFDDAIKSQSVHFEDIQEQIIQEVKKAKYTIWVAVAWFTDKVLFDELMKKKEEGVNVQVIINDDEINRRSGLSFEDLSESYKIPSTGYFNNIMHNKFCVIDLKTVIHGSYNWTKKAQYNQETISIDENRNIAESFSNQFIKLKKQI